ncbi:MAG: hypothetical protein CL878_07725, partial [Dehalococcoidia bacterium]|nr:hypothetical protein [Dehalococcoidia bacterium]
MSILWRVLMIARRYFLWTGLAYLCLLGTTGATLAVPWMLRQIVDRGLIGGDRDYLVFAAFVMIGIHVARGGFQFGVQFLNQYVSERVAFQLRNMLYEHLQRLSFAYHDRSRTGDLISRMTSDINLVRMFTGQDFIRIANTIFLYIAVAIAMFSMHPQLALLSFATIPLVFVAATLYAKRVRPLYRRLQRQFATLTDALQESLMGVRVVKAFAREPYEIEKFDRENERYLTRELAALRLSAAVRPLMLFISAVGVAAILWYGGQETIRDNLTIGMLIAFNAYLLQLAMPTRMIGMTVDRFSRVIASGERLFEILDQPSPVEERPNAIDPGQLHGHVTFDHVSFGYIPDRPVLHEICLDAAPGQTVALIGSTGSGKSSLVSLMPRFYDVTAGSVLIDGRDVRDLQLPALRRQVGIVMQESLLHSVSIGENIAFGRPDASQTEIEAAAQAAQAHEFIVDMPEGYDTIVGERGSTLSGGQRQRVSIARALVLNPPILLLDDATASVDMQTEYEIQQALRTVMQGRTTFVIAQRVSTVQHADQIIVLDEGRIVQRGRHAELAAQPGAYRDIHRAQVGDQEADTAAAEDGSISQDDHQASSPTHAIAKTGPAGVPAIGSPHDARADKRRSKETEDATYRPGVLRRTARHVRPYTWRMSASVLLMIIVAAANLVEPLIIKQVLDVAIPQEDLGLLTLFALAYIAATGVTWVGTFGHTYIMSWVGQRALLSLRRQLFLHLQRLTLSYYDRTSAGEIMSRLTGDAQAINEFL